ncbi:hypothetical protein LOZ65_005294, partial [Ophidiomyces ophidiicola]
MSPSRSEIISSHPIGGRLDEYYNLYNICQPLFEPTSTDESARSPNIKTRAFNFLITFTTLPACHQLISPRGSGALYLEVLRLAANFEIELLLPLLKAVHDKEPDEIIWDKVYEA